MSGANGCPSTLATTLSSFEGVVVGGTFTSLEEEDSGATVAYEAFELALLSAEMWKDLTILICEERMTMRRVADGKAFDNGIAVLLNIIPC